MKQKVKGLLEYMEKAKDELNNLREERKKLSKEKENFSNKETSFYKDVELSYNKKKEEYDAYVKLVSGKVKSKKEEILEDYHEKMDKLDKTNSKLNEDYTRIKSLKEEIYGKKAHLKWLENTIPTEGETNKPNRELLKKLRDNIADLEVETKMLNVKIEANQAILEELVPKDKNPMSVYKELQEETKKIESLNFNNLDETKEFFESKQKSGAEQQKTEQQKPEQQKPEQQKTEQQKTEQQSMREQKQVQQKVVQQRVPEQKQVEQKVVQQSVPEQKPKPANPQPVNAQPVNAQPVNAQPVQRKDSVTIDPKTGLAVFYEEINGKSNQIAAITLEEALKSPRSVRRETFKYIKQYVEEKQGEKFEWKYRNFKRLNPVLLKLFLKAERNDLLSNYIKAANAEEDLKFEYNADMELGDSEAISDKTLYRLNNQLLKDNNDLGTQFEAVKHLRFWHLISRIPVLNTMRLPANTEGKKQDCEEISKNLQEKIDGNRLHLLEGLRPPETANYGLKKRGESVKTFSGEEDRDNRDNRDNEEEQTR